MSLVAITVKAVGDVLVCIQQIADAGQLVPGIVDMIQVFKGGEAVDTGDCFAIPVIGRIIGVGGDVVRVGDRLQAIEQIIGVGGDFRAGAIFFCLPDAIAVGVIDIIES